MGVEFRTIRELYEITYEGSQIEKDSLDLVTILDKPTPKNIAIGNKNAIALYCKILIFFIIIHPSLDTLVILFL